MRKNFIKQSASFIEKNIRKELKQWKRSCIDVDHSACRGRGDLKTKAATYLRSLIEWLRRRRSTRQRKGKGRWENTRPSLSADSRAQRHTRHLISEIPNIFKSTRVCSPSPILPPSAKAGWEGWKRRLSRGAVVSPASFKGVAVFPRGH